MICPECGARNKPGDRFCEQCGTPLGAPPHSPGNHQDIESAATLMAPSGASSAILIRADSGGSEVHNIEARAIVGRLATCDIPVDDKSVSREHARFSQLRDGFVLEDLGSTNGTLVNGRRISETVLLQSGDTITFGSIEFQYQVQDEVVPVTDASAAETLTDFSARPSRSPSTKAEVFSPPAASENAPANDSLQQSPPKFSGLESDPPPVTFPPLEPFSPAARTENEQHTAFSGDVEASNNLVAAPASASHEPSQEYPVPDTEPAGLEVAEQSSMPSQPSVDVWSAQSVSDAPSDENTSTRVGEALLGMENMLRTLSEYVASQRETERMLEQNKQELERAQRQLQEASEQLERMDRTRKDFIASLQDVPEPAMTRQQLGDLQDMLDTLIQNPRDVEILMKIGREAPGIAAVVNEYTQIRRIVERAERST